MIAPCTVCQLVTPSASAAPGYYCGRCDAFLCDSHRTDYWARLLAMRKRDGLGGGLVGWLRRSFALGVLVAFALGAPGAAWADTGVLWSLGPTTLNDQNRIAAGALISDSQIFLFRQDSTDGAGKQLNAYITTDAGVSFQGSINSVNAGLATAGPSAILSAAYIPARARFVLAGVSASGNNAVLYGSDFTWAFGTITGLTGTSPVAHSVTVAASTIIMLVQTSDGGWLCRATSPTATAISFTCQQPALFGSVSALTNTTATGTVQGLAALPGSIWLALDNNNQVWRSINDGVTWTRANSAAVLTANTVLANAIVCLSPSTCVASVSSSASTEILIYQSTNFGLTWTLRHTVTRADRITNLVAVGQGVVLALGDPYQANLPMGYRSRDLGLTWDSIPPQNLSLPVAGTSFVAHQSAWATSLGVAITVSTLCNLTTCTGQVARAAIAPGTDPPFTAFQGPPGTMGNAWWVKATDGTTGPVAVTAASTAAVPADKALVVSLSPNSPLPAGTATTILGTVKQGAPGAWTAPWVFRLVTEGGLDLVKPPFEPATAADPALTVTMAPPDAARPWPIHEQQATTGVALGDITVTSASTIITRAGSRLSLTCVNSGSVNVRVAAGATPTATAGVQVRPAGSYTTTSMAQVSAISEGADSTLSCSLEGR